MIEVTNDQGEFVLADNGEQEPERGSVILTHGEFGTAWQRQFKDGKWHRIGGGRPRDWSWLVKQRRVWLVYDAPVRPDYAEVG
jgi:hypothetical protein